MAEDLYDDLIMEHIRNARNYRAPEPASLEVSGTNPLCGDEITLYVDLRGGHLEDIAFQCTCCGISMASASIMTELLKGRDSADARERIRAFMALLNGRADAGAPAATREQQALLAAARKFASRARCAALPWSTLAGALEQPARARRVR